jgi:ribonucleoside-diphosphate reductase alpha chain
MLDDRVATASKGEHIMSEVATAPPVTGESLADLETVGRPIRQRLPDTRQSLTHKFKICGHEGYLTVGLFEDGRPGELFIKMAKEGSTLSGLMDTVGILTSLALQYGVPVEALARKFEYMRFEPSGWTPNTHIQHAHSIVDYVFRWVGVVFSPAYRQEHEARS